MARPLKREIRHPLESGFRQVDGRLASPGDLLNAHTRLLVSVVVVGRIIPARGNVVNQRLPECVFQFGGEFEMTLVIASSKPL